MFLTIFQLTISHFQLTLGHFQLTLGHFQLTLGHFQLTLSLIELYLFLIELTKTTSDIFYSRSHVSSLTEHCHSRKNVGTLSQREHS